jgi:hypothetical protein
MVARKDRRAGSRSVLHGTGDVQQGATLDSQPAGEERGSPRIKIRVARQPEVQRLELASRAQQEQRRFTATVLGERNFGPQPIDAREPEVIEMADLGHRHEAERLVEGAGVEGGLRSGESTLRPTRRALRERDRALQERRSCGKAPACPSPVSGPFELGRHVLIRRERGLRSMPGTPVRIGPCVGGCSQSPVYLATLGRRRRSIDRRA